MITMGRLFRTDPRNFDETYAIVRKINNPPKGVGVIADLSPDDNLFKDYQGWSHSKQWDTQKFRNAYLPRFIADMQMPKAQEALQSMVEKDKAGKRIALLCYCEDETLCHRSVVAGILKGMGCEVQTKYGDGSEYLEYFDMYKQAQAQQVHQPAMPAAPNAAPTVTQAYHVSAPAMPNPNKISRPIIVTPRHDGSYTNPAITAQTAQPRPNPAAQAPQANRQPAARPAPPTNMNAQGISRPASPPPRPAGQYNSAVNDMQLRTGRDGIQGVGFVE